MDANTSTHQDYSPTMARGCVTWRSMASSVVRALTGLLSLVILSSCATAARRPAAPAPDRSVEPRIDARDTRRAPTPATVPAPAPEPPPPSEVVDRAPIAESPEPAGAPTASTRERPPPSFKSPYLWYCLSWIHGPFYTEDCYPSYKECRAEPVTDEQVVVKNCLAQKQSVWCTERYDAGSEGKTPVHCFGRLDICEMYRAYVGGNGTATSDCAEVATKK